MSAARTRGEAVVETRGLCMHFGGVHAVDGVSVDLYPGEVVALVGGNGAGKTTTFYMVVGLTQPDSGTVMPSRSAITRSCTAASVARWSERPRTRTERCRSPSR